MEDPKLKKRIEEYAKEVEQGKQIRYLMGGFGDMAGCTAVVEEDVFPEEGGSYNRFLGCSYLFPGCPLGMIPSALIEIYGLAKKMSYKLFMDVLNSKLLLLYAFIFWLLQKRRFYAMIEEYIRMLHGHTIGALDFPEKRYNKFATELRRVNKKVFENETHPLAKSAEKLFEVIIFLLEFDTAYKFPAQDALSELNKENDPIKELNRLTDIMVERVQMDYLKERYLKLKKMAIVLRLPMFKRWLTNFFQELDVEAIKMTDADWYFCLRRAMYNFKGVPIKERLEELKRIDKELGHIKVNFKIKYES